MAAALHDAVPPPVIPSAAMPKKTHAELRDTVASLNEDVAVLRARVVQMISDRKPGDPVPFEISNAFDRLLRYGSDLHDALDELAEREGR